MDYPSSTTSGNTSSIGVRALPFYKTARLYIYLVSALLFIAAFVAIACASNATVRNEGLSSSGSSCEKECTATICDECCTPSDSCKESSCKTKVVIEEDCVDGYSRILIIVSVVTMFLLLFVFMVWVWYAYFRQSLGVTCVVKHAQVLTEFPKPEGFDLPIMKKDPSCGPCQFDGVVSSTTRIEHVELPPPMM